MIQENSLVQIRIKKNGENQYLLANDDIIRYNRKKSTKFRVIQLKNEDKYIILSKYDKKNRDTPLYLGICKNHGFKLYKDRKNAFKINTLIGRYRNGLVEISINDLKNDIKNILCNNNISVLYIGNGSSEIEEDEFYDEDILIENEIENEIPAPICPPIQTQTVVREERVIVPAYTEKDVSNLRRTLVTNCENQNAIYTEGVGCVPCSDGFYADRATNTCLPCGNNAKCGDHKYCSGITNPANAQCTTASDGSKFTNCANINTCGGSCNGSCGFWSIFGSTCTLDSGVYSCKLNFWIFFLWILLFIGLIILIYFLIKKFFLSPKSGPQQGTQTSPNILQQQQTQPTQKIYQQQQQTNRTQQETQTTTNIQQQQQPQTNTTSSITTAFDQISKESVNTIKRIQNDAKQMGEILADSQKLNDNLKLVNQSLPELVSSITQTSGSSVPIPSVPIQSVPIKSVPIVSTSLPSAPIQSVPISAPIASVPISAPITEPILQF